MNLSEYLKSEIARRNLSVRKASDHIGVSHVTLLRILSGETPNLETLSKLSEWTRTDLAFLLELLGYQVEGDNEGLERLSRLVEFDPLYRRILTLLEQLGQEQLVYVIEYVEYLAWRLDAHEEQRREDPPHPVDVVEPLEESVELSQQNDISTDISVRSEG